MIYSFHYALCYTLLTGHLQFNLLVVFLDLLKKKCDVKIEHSLVGHRTMRVAYYACEQEIRGMEILFMICYHLGKITLEDVDLSRYSRDASCVQNF